MFKVKNKYDDSDNTYTVYDVCHRNYKDTFFLLYDEIYKMWVWCNSDLYEPL